MQSRLATPEAKLKTEITEPESPKVTLLVNQAAKPHPKPLEPTDGGVRLDNFPKRTVDLGVKSSVRKVRKWVRKPQSTQVHQVQGAGFSGELNSRQLPGPATPFGLFIQTRSPF